MVPSSRNQSVRVIAVGALFAAVVMAAEASGFPVGAADAVVIFGVTLLFVLNWEMLGPRRWAWAVGVGALLAALMVVGAPEL